MGYVNYLYFQVHDRCSLVRQTLFFYASLCACPLVFCPFLLKPLLITSKYLLSFALFLSLRGHVSLCTSRDPLPQ